jgi:hypothetical protein
MTVPNSMTPRTLLVSLLSELPAAMPIELSRNEGYLYEAYLFGIVLRAARSAGFSVELMDGNRPALTLRLRGGPGRLPALRPTGTYWTNALLSCAGRPPLEVHTAVSVVGKSRVIHEADVLVLPQADAVR